ncbi:cilia- and flagella-associated protein 74 [Hylobates moloch]|uniref:cilia- and flagella-associated protein 74 n=1 Tax=Hylobates moloch TaxID=81572 RepID=UPI0013F1D8AB|nr:cilia- and flagella-associated protein 74 [Hylobates moloch]
MEDDGSLLPEDELLADAPLLEDERDELEDPEFDIKCLLQEAEDDVDPGHSSSVKELDTDADKLKKKTAEDRMQAFHLRQNLSALDKMHEEQELFIEKMRGELRACRQRQDLIDKQQEAVAAEIATEEEAGNIAAVGRLRAVSRRLFAELENERDLQSRTEAVLKERENALWHIEIQEGRLEAFRTVDRGEVEATGRRLQVCAAERLCREQEAPGKVERNRLLRIRKSLHTQKELGLRHQKLLEDARKNHRVAVRFLKASLGRIREQEKKEEMECHEHMRRRMDAVVALKGSISANRDTLRKFQAWDRAKAELAEQRVQAEKKAILVQGGDAFRHLVHQRRHQELEAQKRAFEEEQKLRKQEIVSRILKEEAEEEKRKKQRPPTRARHRPTLRDRTWNYISDFCEEKTTIPTNMYTLDYEAAAGPGPSRLVEVVSSELIQGDPGASSEEETLAEPEISGLWNEDYKPYQVPKEDVDRKPVGGTKMDKDILARTVERLRGRVVHKQVVLGREFQGRPFHSRPELLHFKDFDIGKVYKKKITLVNTTYTINYCKLVGVEEHLRDFIHVAFDPPGRLSAGMSCEVLVTFKPMINKDLEGNISFLAQTGEFSVPLKCSTKKCSLSLDKELIDFGSYVVGETTSRTITLTNVGGLGTTFKFLPATEPCEMDDSQSALKLSSLLTYEDKSLYDKAATSFSEQQLEGTESSQADMQSRKELEKLDKEQEEEQPAEPETFTTVIPPSEEQTEITLGEITEGEIGPFSSIKVPIIFTPVVPGDVQARFKVTFKNPQCPTLHFRVMGVAIDVPVWVPKPSVDLKICMYDRLYQDSVLVHTRSKAALRLKFEVCKELRAHLELLPETGYIQAQSSYSVQLKFLPRSATCQDKVAQDKALACYGYPARCLVQVAFRPVLPEKLIRQEALPLLNKEMETKSFRKDMAPQRKDLHRLSFSILRAQNRDKLFKVSVPHVLEMRKRELKPSSDEYQAAQATLVRAFQAKFDTFVVPCVVASGDIKDRKGSEPLSFSPHNTLYLELWCPTVAPSVVVTSHKGKTIFNFGDVAVGHRSIKKVSIQNISPEDLALDFSLLNPNGPFVLLNHSSLLRAGDTQVLVLSFSPHESILAQETLDIITKRGTLTLTLVGTGVASMITCSIEGSVLNMGHVIAGESVSSGFKLQNNSLLPIKFSMHLDSLSSTRGRGQQQMPQFLSSPSQRTEVVGTQNLNGQSVFSVAPVKGVMDPGKTQDFTVTFSPDHESLYFSDRLQVVLFEKKISHQILLTGAACEHMMFVEGGDPLDVPVESLTAIPVFEPRHREASSRPGPPSPEAEELRPILVTLDYIQFDTDTPAPPATRELQVGCIRTTQPSPKKTVEFSMDSVASLQHKGFSIEPSRGSVERGQTKTISISWVPPADFDPDHPLMVSALLQLRGDVKETYKVIFVAQVVTGP